MEASKNFQSEENKTALRALQGRLVDRKENNGDLHTEPVVPHSEEMPHNDTGTMSREVLNIEDVAGRKDALWTIITMREEIAKQLAAYNIARSRMPAWNMLRETVESLEWDIVAYGEADEPNKQAKIKSSIELKLTKVNDLKEKIEEELNNSPPMRNVSETRIPSRVSSSIPDAVAAEGVLPKRESQTDEEKNVVRDEIAKGISSRDNGVEEVRGGSDAEVSQEGTPSLKEIHQRVDALFAAAREIEFKPFKFKEDLHELIFLAKKTTRNVEEEKRFLFLLRGLEAKEANLKLHAEKKDVSLNTETRKTSRFSDGFSVEQPQEIKKEIEGLFSRFEEQFKTQGRSMDTPAGHSLRGVILEANRIADQAARENSIEKWQTVLSMMESDIPVAYQRAWRDSGVPLHKGFEKVMHKDETPSKERRGHAEGEILHGRIKAVRELARKFGLDEDDLFEGDLTRLEKLLAKVDLNENEKEEFQDLLSRLETKEINLKHRVELEKSSQETQSTKVEAPVGKVLREGEMPDVKKIEKVEKDEPLLITHERDSQVVQQQDELKKTTDKIETKRMHKDAIYEQAKIDAARGYLKLARDPRFRNDVAANAYPLEVVQKYLNLEPVSDREEALKNIEKRLQEIDTPLYKTAIEKQNALITKLHGEELQEEDRTRLKRQIGKIQEQIRYTASPHQREVPHVQKEAIVPSPPSHEEERHRIEKPKTGFEYVTDSIEQNVCGVLEKLGIPVPPDISKHIHASVLETLKSKENTTSHGNNELTPEERNDIEDWYIGSATAEALQSNKKDALIPRIAGSDAAKRKIVGAVMREDATDQDYIALGILLREPQKPSILEGKSSKKAGGILGFFRIDPNK